MDPDPNEICAQCGDVMLLMQTAPDAIYWCANCNRAMPSEGSLRTIVNSNALPSILPYGGMVEGAERKHEHELQYKAIMRSTLSQLFDGPPARACQHDYRGGIGRFCGQCGQPNRGQVSEAQPQVQGMSFNRALLLAFTVAGAIVSILFTCVSR